MQVYTSAITNKRISANKVKSPFADNNAFFLSSNISFKRLSPTTVNEAVKIFEEKIGSYAGKHLDETIKKILSAINTGVKKLEDGRLDFAEDTFGKKIYRAIIDPIVHLPLDFANSTLNLFKKIPGLKNSKFIDKLLKTPALNRRSTDLENYSNTMALQHYFEMLKKKDGRDEVLREAVKRFKIGGTEYTVRGERSLTRLVSGLFPAFFLATDTYSLSMYMNNNKDLARKEKKRRFYQEVVRVVFTAAATFGTLGYFAKEVSSNPTIAAGIIASLTLASELIGRILVGTPIYPLGKEGAKKYAKLRNKDRLNHNTEKNAVKQKLDKKGKSESSYAMKILGGMVLAGFLIDKHQSIKPIRKLVNNLKIRYKEFFAKDYTISMEEFKKIIAKLRENKDFEPLAKHYEKTVEDIINEGNLTTKERLQVEREINNRFEQYMPDRIIWNQDKLKKLQTEKMKNVRRKDVIKDLNFTTTRNNDILNISGDLGKFFFKEGSNVDKRKDIIINGILALPIKFVWEILNIPYKYVVKPLIELLFKGKDMFKSENEVLPDEEIFRKGIEFLRKNYNAPDFKEKVAKHTIDAFDNVNKSNISSAELAGSAKVAVSTITSGSLIFDNYNTVMVDSEGEDKKLAEQKAKERTLQRIVRIAYGACLIKLFNGIFKSQYDASLLGAEAVTVGNVLLTETLERTSVGMPLHEATREEIIQKDNETLNATGLKGAYFRFMAKLTGKKPLSYQKGE